MQFIERARVRRLLPNRDFRDMAFDAGPDSRAQALGRPEPAACSFAARGAGSSAKTDGTVAARLPNTMAMAMSRSANHWRRRWAARTIRRRFEVDMKEPYATIKGKLIYEQEANHPSETPCPGKIGRNDIVRRFDGHDRSRGSRNCPKST